ncbi:MAG: excinuclease ABC subunit UvrA [Phycisphaeraceae bacterium]|nr:excinuclease ABC subunit UvrA [Phycisphaeraceae bacterium]
MARRVKTTTPAAIVEPKASGASTEPKKPGKARPTPARGADVVASAHAVADRCIRVRGAREHNLRNIDLTLPRDRLIVMTGLSGSGKSSLAFDTIFAEGQRKYMESLSAYARQFLDQLKKPDVDEVEGIPPTIAIEQRSASSNPRSTVATTTEIYDYLRLLFARCGTPHSWAPTRTRKDGSVEERSGALISATSASQIVDAVMKSAPDAATDSAPRMMVLAPVVREKKGFHKDVLEELQRQGWGRARVNGTLVELREALKEGGDNPLGLGRYEKHSIEAVIDRIVLRADVRQRLAESIEAALRLGDGAVVIAVQEPGAEAWRDQWFSEKFADPERPEFALEELSPRLFSFNSPTGACATCHGLGAILEFDEALVAPEPERPLLAGGIAPWKKNGPGGMIYPRKLKWFCRTFNVSPSAPVGDLAADVRKLLFHGGGTGKTKAWPGVLPMLKAWWEKTESQWVREHLQPFMAERTCPECSGDRLRIEALHVLVRSAHFADVVKARSATVIGRPVHDGSLLNIAELSRLTITDALAFVEQLRLSSEQQRIAEPILREVGNRLRFLMSVGLEYLSLDRRTGTLSGGEAQRIRLATQVGSGLVGACYVLDEPTIGLHPRDNSRLIRTLRHLCDIGNTVLVVEHDEEMIRSADHLVDIGPGAGVHGGRVVAQGTVHDICAAPASLTGDYLSRRRSIPVPASRRTLNEKDAIVVKGARQNNLRGIDVAFPLGGLVCVTGVSGSGKSTLVNDILLKSLLRELNKSRVVPGAHARITGLKRVNRVIEVDQSPIGRTPRSNAATYTGIFDDIRALFSQTKEARIRGYKPGRFSFNVSSQQGGGRCEACQGQGLKKIEMHFLPDVYVECEICDGRRYNRETLEVHYRGKSVADVLGMTVEQACEFFDSHPKILRFVECLRDVGLGYITLGQPSTQLSGGEAQRVKLATELGKGGGTKNSPGAYSGAIYILDEPTTGLHFEDVRRLVEVLHRLIDAGNTAIVIEHNLDVIKCADWIIDLGPEGGAGGGQVVACGPPETVASAEASHTGRALKSVLSVPHKR